MHKAVEAIGEARNDFDIFRALARRLGYEHTFSEGRDEMAWCQWVYDQLRAKAAAKGVALPGWRVSIFLKEQFVIKPSPPSRAPPKDQNESEFR